MRKPAASEIQRRRNEKMKLLRRDGTEIGEGESLREIAEDQLPEEARKIVEAAK